MKTMIENIKILVNVPEFFATYQKLTKVYRFHIFQNFNAASDRKSGLNIIFR